MRGRNFAITLAAVGLAACNQADGGGATNAATNAAATAVKHPTYCFFKDADTKSWSVSAAADGNVAVKGKAHLEDRRYRGDIGESEVAGDSAKVWLTMAPNTTGYGAPDDWWDVSTTIPASGGVNTVTVLCGKKQVAELKVRR
jgi:hypothetical protein